MPAVLLTVACTLLALQPAHGLGVAPGANGTEVTDGDGGPSDGGEATSDGCCPSGPYRGMVEHSKGYCKAHEYRPGLFHMLTNARTRQLAQSSYGDRSRLLAALQRFRDGGNLTVAVIGGSIAAGQGAVDAPAFPAWMRMFLEAQMPGGASRVRVNNGAVPGTSSQYMSTCHNVHVPADVDIVFVEYAVNDEEMPMPHMNNQVRRPYERLLRKLLSYRNRPAVILVHAFRWFQIPALADQAGAFWTSSERQHMEFGLYYSLPQVSIKAACYHLMAKGVEGFQVKRPRADQHGKIQYENFIDGTLKGKAFYYDIVHPDGHTGHRIMAEVALQVIWDAWAQVASGYNVTEEDVASINEPLPPPMLKNNLESRSDKCFIGPAFQRTVTNASGFAWVNEGKHERLPKWGYVAEQPGMSIKMQIDTTVPGSPMKEVTVELGFLKSYENMGRAAVQCEGGCKCTAWVLDGHQDARNSQTFLHPFKVTQASECIIAVTVVDATTTGKHKVKLTGIMVSEDPDANAFANWAAWDWISIASSKDANGVFEMRNIARRMLEEHAESSGLLELQRQYYEAQGGGTGALRRRNE